jgi:hypothetical protein
MKLVPLILFFAFNSMAALKFPSDRLKVMDVETLQRMVNSNLSLAQQALSQSQDSEYLDEGQEPITEYTQEDGARLVRESLELVFAVPEQSGATSNIYSLIEGVALEYGGVLSFLEDITDAALKTLAQKGKDKALIRDQNTYIYILNNIMAEIKPLTLTPEGEKYRKLVEKIRDEKIRFSDSLKSYRMLNSMSKVVNPSRVAEQIVGKKKCAWWDFWC